MMTGCEDIRYSSGWRSTQAVPIPCFNSPERSLSSAHQGATPLDEIGLDGRRVGMVSYSMSETAPWGFLSGPPSKGRDLGHEVAPVSSSVVVDFGAPRHVDGRGTNSDCNSVIGGEVGPV